MAFRVVGDPFGNSHEFPLAKAMESDNTRRIQLLPEKLSLLTENYESHPENRASAPQIERPHSLSP